MAALKLNLQSKRRLVRGFLTKNILEPLARRRALKIRRANESRISSVVERHVQLLSRAYDRLTAEEKRHFSPSFNNRLLRGYQVLRQEAARGLQASHPNYAALEQSVIGHAAILMQELRAEITAVQERLRVIEGAKSYEHSDAHQEPARTGEGHEPAHEEPARTGEGHEPAREEPAVDYHGTQPPVVPGEEPIEETEIVQERLSRHDTPNLGNEKKAARKRAREERASHRIFVARTRLKGKRGATVSLIESLGFKFRGRNTKLAIRARRIGQRDLRVQELARAGKVTEVERIIHGIPKRVQKAVAYAYALRGYKSAVGFPFKTRVKWQQRAIERAESLALGAQSKALKARPFGDEHVDTVYYSGVVFSILARNDFTTARCKENRKVVQTCIDELDSRLSEHERELKRVELRIENLARRASITGLDERLQVLPQNVVVERDTLTDSIAHYQALLKNLRDFIA